MNSLSKSAPVSPASLPEITYRLATTRSELEQAFSLVYESYVRVGLEQHNGRRIRLTKYHLLPGTRVFVAVARSGEHAGKVVGTLSVIPDSILGLPAEAVAAREIANLRRQGQRSAEFIALASNERGSRNRVTLKLFRLAFEFCRTSGYSNIVAALTSRHIGFYRRFLGFSALGELKPYQMGNGTPVQAHTIDTKSALNLIEQRSAALQCDADWRNFSLIEYNSVMQAASSVHPWDPDTLGYFTEQSPHLAEQLDAETVAILRAEYRRYGGQFDYYDRTPPLTA